MKKFLLLLLVIILLGAAVGLLWVSVKNKSAVKNYLKDLGYAVRYAIFVQAL